MTYIHNSAGTRTRDHVTLSISSSIAMAQYAYARARKSDCPPNTPLCMCGQPTHCCGFLSPETMSSMRSSMQEDSMEVLMVWTLTEYGSQTPSSFMSTSVPLHPSTRHDSLSPPACLARSWVISRTTSAPQFWASVRGMTSNACATARYGHCWMPSTSAADSESATESAISVAPPPGSMRGSNTMLRATCIASCRLRSSSLSTSRLPPRSSTVHALGSAHSSKKAKYSSPILRTSNRPQPVPMSLSWISSQRETMVAPAERATRLLSVLRSRRNAVMP